MPPTDGRDADDCWTTNSTATDVVQPQQQAQSVATRSLESAIGMRDRVGTITSSPGCGVMPNRPRLNARGRMRANRRIVYIRLIPAVLINYTY